MRLSNFLFFRNILLDEKWEVRKNAAGNEVVVLRDGSEPSSSSSETNGEDLSECDGTLLSEEENWDCDESCKPTDSLGTFCCVCDWNCSTASGTSVNCTLAPDESVLSSTNVSVDGGNVTVPKTPVSNSCKDSTNDMNSSLQDNLGNDVSCTLNSSVNSSLKSAKPNETTLDHSVYQTPQSSSWKVQCANKDIPSHHESIGNGCNELNDEDTLRSSLDLNFSSNVPPSRSTMSPFETSTYSTPCCSQVHKTQIPKCLSLQQINSESPTLQLDLNNSNNDTSIREQKDKVSKSLEGLVNQDSFEIQESCSNASKVVDSGYPESNSDHDMDLDLTPEQFDDIDSESDENIDGSLPSPLVPAPLIVDDVENGDVANNNRDGEGNNLIADMDQEPFEFEAQIIEELYHEVPNFEGADVLLRQEFENPSKEEESVEDQICDDCLDQQPHDTINNKALESGTDNSMNNTEFATEPASLSKNISTDQHLKAVQSDTSIATSDSWCKLVCPENNTFSDNQDSKSSSASKDRNVELKAHNSLTTVLDGISSLSNCSIVKPVDKTFDNSERVRKEINTKSSLKTGVVVHNDEEGGKEETRWTKVNTSSSQQDNNSLISLSEYCSAESLNDRIGDLEVSDFPDWLLSIDLDVFEELDYDSFSLFSQLENASYEELEGLNYDVPVDSRGGGDPQGDRVVNFPVNM